MQSALLIFRESLVDFKNSLRRVRDIAEDVLANALLALSDSKLRARQETALSAVVVILSGFFESFIRDIAERYANEVASKGLTFSDLPMKIQYAHFVGGGAVLHKLSRKTLSSANDISRRLASVNGPPPYELLWEAFAETKGNPGADVVRDFLSRFGVQKPMELLAVHVGKTANTISAQLDSFLAVRNECAHSGMPPTAPTAVDVIDFCNLLEEIANGIVSVLSAHTI
jgi:hypothetical protein